MLNPEGTYAITHRVELAECDPKDRMRLSWIMRLQQEAGEKQLLELGIGHQKLWEEGMVFLLSKMAVQILQTPRYLQEIVVEKGHKWAGHSLRQIPTRSDTLIVLIRRGNETIIPGGSTVLQPGDTLVIAQTLSPPASASS